MLPEILIMLNGFVNRFQLKLYLIGFFFVCADYVLEMLLKGRGDEKFEF